MTEDVGTTPRKPLSPKERLAIFERERGICCLCERPITDRKWIDEHKRALGLGGSNEPENRGIAHIACADLKTHGPGGDKEMTDRAKRVKRKEIVPRIVDKPGTLQGPQFAKSPKAFARAAKGHRPSLPIRMLPGFVSASERSRS